MAKKSLNMMEKIMDPNIIDYYIINCAIPSIITTEYRYQINFGKPAVHGKLYYFPLPGYVLIRLYRNAEYKLQEGTFLTGFDVDDVDELKAYYTSDIYRIILS